MISRLFWALLGLGLGLVLGLRVLRVVEEAQSKAKPERVARDVGRAAGSFQSRLREAVDEGRAAATEREAALRERFGVPSFDELVAQHDADQRAADTATTDTPDDGTTP